MGVLQARESGSFGVHAWGWETGIVTIYPLRNHFDFEPAGNLIFALSRSISNILFQVATVKRPMRKETPDFNPELRKRNYCTSSTIRPALAGRNMAPPRDATSSSGSASRLPSRSLTQRRTVGSGPWGPSPPSSSAAARLFVLGACFLRSLLIVSRWGAVLVTSSFWG